MTSETLILYSQGSENGKPLLSKTGQEALRKFWAKIKEGTYVLTLTEQKKYKRSRYKFYFGVLLQQAVQQFNDRGVFQIENEETGELSALTTEDLHELLKQYFNPVLVKYQGMRIIKGGSTRKLSDSEFINEYVEKIYVFLSEHNIEVQTYQEYREEMSNQYQNNV